MVQVVDKRELGYTVALYVAAKTNCMSLRPLVWSTWQRELNSTVSTIVCRDMSAMVTTRSYSSLLGTTPCRPTAGGCIVFIRTAIYTLWVLDYVQENAVPPV